MPAERRQRGEPIAWTGRTGQNFRQIQQAPFRPPAISRLSDEQLWGILYLIAGDPLSWDTSPAASLSLVCKKWKTIIDCNPSLWTYIFIDENMTFPRLRMHLARSGTDPLHIHFSNFDYDPEEEKDDPGRKERRRAFMNNVWENLPRCRYLVLGDPLITLIVLSMMPSHIRLSQLNHLSIVWPSLGQLTEGSKIDRRKWMQPMPQLDAPKLFSNLRSLMIVTEGLTLDGFSWSILLWPGQSLKKLALHIQSIKHQQEFVVTLHDVHHSLEKLTIRVEKDAGALEDLPALPALRTLRFGGDFPPGWLRTFVASANSLHQLTLDIVQTGVDLRNAIVFGPENFLPPIPTLKTLRICYTPSMFVNSQSEHEHLMKLFADWLNRLPSLTTFTFIDSRKPSLTHDRFGGQIIMQADPMLIILAEQGVAGLRISNLNFLYVLVSAPALENFLHARDPAINQLGSHVIPRLYMRMTELHGYPSNIFQMAAQRGVNITGEY